MKLKDEIAELVDARVAEVTRLFQDSDRISINPEDIKRLTDALPLIQDIKTEVSDIGRQVHDLKEQKKKNNNNNRKPDSGDGDGSDGVDSNEPINDPDMRKLLDDYDKLKKELDKLNGALRRERLPGNTPDVDVLEGIRNFYVLWRLWKEMIQDKVIDAMGLDSTSLIQNNIVREADRIYTLLKGLELKLNNCCTNIQDLLLSIKSKLDECCKNMSDAMAEVLDDTGAIKRALNVLNPDRQADQTLGLEAKARAILSELNTIRGLL